MRHFLFATDIHGRLDRYDKLFACVAEERPGAVFLGGDLLAAASLGVETTEPCGDEGFIAGYLKPCLERLRRELGAAYPAFFIILGNDDGRLHEKAMRELEGESLLWYMHGRHIRFLDLDVYGYSYVPPTPFWFKDWERYDVSRYTDPGCTAPNEGIRSTSAAQDDARFATIQEDLEQLTDARPLDRAILLFHSPPYQTKLDRAALDGRSYDHVPLDVHVGSIAIRRLIESRPPLLTLHGHVHESARLTGAWRDRIGRTHMFSAAHDGPELAVVRFDPDRLDDATRELV